MGGMTAEQFQAFMRPAHQTSGEAVRQAYMRGGMDMHGLYQQQDGQREAAPRAAVRGIRATTALGDGTLP